MASPNQQTCSTFSTALLIEASLESAARLEQLDKENNELKRRLETSSRSTYGNQVPDLLKCLEEERSKVARLNERLLLTSNQYEQKMLHMKEAFDKKQSEVTRLRERHASISEKKVKMDQRRTENTLSTNRQSELESEYITEFKDGRRVDAVDVIQTRMSSQKSKKPSTTDMDRLVQYRLACFIFEISYECASAAKELFAGFSSSVLETLVTKAPLIGSEKESFKKKYRLFQSPSKEQSTATQDALSDLMVLVKEAADKHDLDNLIQTVKSTVKTEWSRADTKRGYLPRYDSKLLEVHLADYMEYCTKFAWRIVTQVPPLKLDYQSSTYNQRSHMESQSFSSAGQESTSGRHIDSEAPEISCYLWPILHDCDRRVLQKGEVTLKQWSTTTRI